MTQAAEVTYVCSDCGDRLALKDLREIKDVLQRVAPGEIMPVGECPCGALAHREDEPKKEVPVDVLNALQSALSWVDDLWPDRFDNDEHEANCVATRDRLGDVLEKAKEKRAATTFATQEEINEARDEYCNHSDDNIEVDDFEVRTSETEDGKWIQAWLWLPKGEESTDAE